MEKFRCKVCLYIHEGDSAPDICPKCGAPKEQFEKIPENISILIDRAKTTNRILMEAYTKLKELSSLTKEGIEDNLDPACLYIFQRINECCKIMENMIISEINIHTQRNKWG